MEVVHACPRSFSSFCAPVRGEARMAEHYACLTQEQEERENAEARERFAESQRKKQGGSKTE